MKNENYEFSAVYNKANNNKKNYKDTKMISPESFYLFKKVKEKRSLKRNRREVVTVNPFRSLGLLRTETRELQLVPVDLDGVTGVKQKGII